MGYQEKPLIAVNMVGIINARCHFTEASQQKVEAAAHRRDVGNSNQQEKLWRHQMAPTIPMPTSLVIYTSFFSTSQSSA